MKYISTRGQAPALTSKQTALAGLASDGGLYVPSEFPQFSNEDLQQLVGKSFCQVACAVLSRLDPDTPRKVLWDRLRDAFTPERFCYATNGDNPSDIVPVRHLYGKTHLLRAVNGPTLAFKDVALQYVARKMEYALQGNPLNVFGSTSGDTGSAAIEALRGRKGIKVFMLSGGAMSDFQKAQMFCVDDSNIFNINVNGTFDDAQAVVKALNNDAQFREDYHLGAVNSINWDRIAMQIAYWFWGYLKMQPNIGEVIDVVIPSGNFGNAEAAGSAKAMGLPIRHIVLGTNENDVLHQFVQTGVYRKALEVTETISPSMDIQVASNLERYIHRFYAGDGSKVASLYDQFEASGEFDLSDELERIHAGGLQSQMCSEHDCRVTMKQVFEKTGVMIDPHTAVAMFAAAHSGSADVPKLVIETAQPVKFAQTVNEVIGQVAPVPPALAGLGCAPQHVTKMDPDEDQIRQFIIDHA